MRKVYKGEKDLRTRTHFFIIVTVLLSSLISPIRTLSQPPLFSDEWRWAHFTTENGLPSDQIKNISEADDGTIWVVTSKGIVWFDGYGFVQPEGLPFQSLCFNISPYYGDSILLVSGGFRAYVASKKTHRLLSVIDKTLGIIAYDTNFFYYHLDHKIYAFRNGDTTFCSECPPHNAGEAFHSWRLYHKAVCLDLKSGIYKLEGKQWESFLPAKNGPFNVRSFSFSQSHDGLLVITNPIEDRGIWEWYNNEKPVKSNFKLNGIDVKATAIDNHGDAVVIFESGDFSIRQNGAWKTYSNLPRLDDANFTLFSTTNDFWLGTERGLYLYRSSNSYWTIQKYPQSDPRNNINEIMRAKDSTLWVGTSDGIVRTSPGKKSDWIRTINGKSLYAITGLGEDNRGRIWIGSGSTFPGSYVWDGTTWKHVDFGTNPNQTYIHKIVKDRHGNLWFLGLAHEGISSHFNQPGAFVLEQDSIKEWTESHGLKNKRVYAFADSPDGALWFGTTDGLFKWKDGIWKTWNVYNSRLIRQRIFTLAVDSNSVLWFGDQEGTSGLGYLDNNEKVHYLSTIDGLASDYVWALNTDQQGTLWISTQGGLQSYHHGIFRTYNEKSGLPIKRVWPNLPFADNVYVGTLGAGLAILDKNAELPPAPNIIIEYPSIEEQTVKIIWSVKAYMGELLPAQIQTRHRINNENWSGWGNERSIIFTNLDPGNYTFYVQAKGAFGQYDELGKQAFFIIPPPLYLRPIFFAPIGSLSLIVVTLLTLYLVRRRRSNIELKKSEERFRTVSETTRSAIFIFSDSTMLLVNREATALLGYSEEELLRRTFGNILHPEYHHSFFAWTSLPVHQGASPTRIEARVICENGGERWVDVILAPISFEGMNAVIATAFDITERKETEEQLRAYQNSLRSLSSQLAIIEEQERRKMATYLHDTIGVQLAVCKMQLGELTQTLTNVSNPEQFREIRQHLDKAINDTRMLTMELCPPILYELGLQAALEWLAEKMANEHALDYSFLCDREEYPVSEEIEIVVFHAVRELLVNIIKHAKATIMVVIMQERFPYLEVIVEDDGNGFDSNAIRMEKSSSSVTEKPFGYGLFNVRERIEHFGGNVEISSYPQASKDEKQKRGTRIVLSVPLLRLV